MITSDGRTSLLLQVCSELLHAAADLVKDDPKSEMEPSEVVLLTPNAEGVAVIHMALKAGPSPQAQVRTDSHQQHLVANEVSLTYATFCLTFLIVHMALKASPCFKVITLAMGALHEHECHRIRSVLFLCCRQQRCLSFKSSSLPRSRVPAWFPRRRRHQVRVK